MSSKRYQSKALQHVYDKGVGDNPPDQAVFQRENGDILIQIEVSQLLCGMRTGAGTS